MPGNSRRRNAIGWSELGGENPRGGCPANQNARMARLAAGLIPANTEKLHAGRTPGLWGEWTTDVTQHAGLPCDASLPAARRWPASGVQWHMVGPIWIQENCQN
ncbi:hypothetical protein VTN96DRAFT_6425 [Rasamsonia emersonii]